MGVERAVAADRLVSLAAGDGPRHRAGGDGGCPRRSAATELLGLWFDPDTWTDGTTRAVGARLEATGLIALDIEPVILGRDVDPGNAVVDTAAQLGVRHVLLASGPASRAAVVERYGAKLCRRAEPAGVRVVLEFLPIFTIATLGDALGVVQEVDSPSAGVLVDTLHLAPGGGPADLVEVPAELLPYLQLADAPDRLDDPTGPACANQALHGRLLPGQGQLPLGETLETVPDVPVSVELRSQALMQAFPDPTDRAPARSWPRNASWTAEPHPRRRRRGPTLSPCSGSRLAIPPKSSSHTAAMTPSSPR